MRIGCVPGWTGPAVETAGSRGNAKLAERGREFDSQGRGQAVRGWDRRSTESGETDEHMYTVDYIMESTLYIAKD